MIVLIFAITLLIYILNSCKIREGIVNVGSYTSLRRREPTVFYALAVLFFCYMFLIAIAIISLSFALFL